MANEKCINERSEMELITAQQLAVFGGRDAPNVSDTLQAVELVARWNNVRLQLGLTLWL